MKILFWNLVLAFAWTALVGELTSRSLIIGFLIGSPILLVTQRARDSSHYFRKIFFIVRLVFLFFWELILSGLWIAYDVLTPSYYMNPGIIAVPLDVQSDEEITLLANLISLTPGTLSLEVSKDRKTLYVHAMYITDKQKLIQEIKNGFERYILEISR